MGKWSHLHWHRGPRDETIGSILEHAAPEEWAAYQRAWQERGDSLEFLREVAPKEVQRFERANADVAVAAQKLARAYPDWWAKMAALVGAAQP